MRFAVILFAISGASALHGAGVSVSQVTTSPGGTVSIDVRYSAQGALATGIQFDLDYDNANLGLTSAAGAASTGAGKSLSVSDLLQNKKRFLIAGLNQTAISDGILVTLTIAVKSGAAAQTYPLRVSNVSASDKNGQNVPVTPQDGSVAVISGGALPRSGVLSHIAAGGGWTTVITLINTSSATVSVTVALHNDDGSSLSLPVTSTQQGATQTTTTASFNATLSPNATLILSMGDQVVNLVAGWADVLSSGPVGGYAIFRSTPKAGSPSEGTVALQSQFSSTMTLPYDNAAGFVMGVAVANLSTASANITATIWDESGLQIGTQTITVAGSGHTAFVLPSQLPPTTGKRGVVQLQGSGGISIAGLGLRFSPFGTFTSVPTI